MMGRQPPPQENLFHIGVSLETRVRQDHPLRAIDKAVDFDFISPQVKSLYGDNGNVSVPPPVILKLMLLLVLYNVRSERELMLTAPERLDQGPSLDGWQISSPGLSMTMTSSSWCITQLSSSAGFIAAGSSYNASVLMGTVLALAASVVIAGDGTSVSMVNVALLEDARERPA